MDKFVSDLEVDLIAKYVPEGRLLEIGTGAGHSSTRLASLCPKLTIYTVDSFGLAGDMRVYSSFDVERVSGVFKQLQNLPNVIQILSDSTKLKWELPLDGLFIDGGHYYETVKADYDNFSPFVKKGFIFFHDYWREDFGVKQVVEESGLEVIYKDKMAICVK